MSLGSFASVVSVKERTSGRFYAEVRFDGNEEVDYSSMLIGISAMLQPLPGLSPVAEGIGVDPGSAIQQYSEFLPAEGFPIFPGDTIRIAVDLDTGLVWFGRNADFLGDPAAGTGAVNEGMPLTVGAPMVVYATFNEGQIPQGESMKFTLRATAAQFVFTRPSGFAPWES